MITVYRISPGNYEVWTDGDRECYQLWKAPELPTRRAWTWYADADVYIGGKPAKTFQEALQDLLGYIRECAELNITMRQLAA